MSEHDRNSEPERSDPQDGIDPDTTLILDYLSNKLSSDQVEKLEARARDDKEFRYKLADIVLLKGLVTLALERHPPRRDRACRRARRTFTDYRRGRTSAKKTAELSRHLDECLDCEMAFERFQGHDADGLDPSGWGASPRVGRPSRRLAIVGVVAAALAAGAFGIVALMSSAAAPRPGAPAGAPPEADGLVLRPGEIRSVLAEVAAADPGLDAGGALTQVVEEILDPATEPRERAAAYRRIGKEFGAPAERLLWAMASREPIGHARASAYQALAALPPRDADALLAAARREARVRSQWTPIVAEPLLAHLSPEVREFLRELVCGKDAGDDEWSAMNLRLVYPAMRGDPAIEDRLTGALSHRNHVVRSIAASTAADAGDARALPVALELLGSDESSARFYAEVVLSRHATPAQLHEAHSRDWSQSPKTRLAIEKIMQARGFAVPKQP